MGPSVFSQSTLIYASLSILALDRQIETGFSVKYDQVYTDILINPIIRAEIASINIFFSSFLINAIFQLLIKNPSSSWTVQLQT